MHGGNTEIPNFDMSVKTRSGERLWINMSTIVFDNQRTGRRLMVHMAHDITKQKKNEELTQKMLELSKQVSSLAEASVRAEPAALPNNQGKTVSFWASSLQPFSAFPISLIFCIATESAENGLCEGVAIALFGSD
jgi:hypothetical protein